MKRIGIVLVIIIVLTFGVSFVIGAPYGATDIDYITSSRGVGGGAGASIPAIAGNVTELIINGTVITSGWQGYYGNITGEIVLENSGGYRLYDWSEIGAVKGQVYATTFSGAITWASITCMDFLSETEYNITQFNTEFGYSGIEGDALDKTFTDVGHPAFSVGTVPISASSCNSTYTYVNNATQTAAFSEVMLTDTTYPVFTTLINDSATGFDNQAHDFQMLVAEDGRDGDTSTTDYYFYVELF